MPRTFSMLYFWKRYCRAASTVRIAATAKKQRITTERAMEESVSARAKSPSSENGVVPLKTRSKSRAQGNNLRFAFVNATVAQKKLGRRWATKRQAKAAIREKAGPATNPSKATGPLMGVMGERSGT